MVSHLSVALSVSGFSLHCCGYWRDMDLLPLPQSLSPPTPTDLRILCLHTENLFNHHGQLSLVDCREFVQSPFKDVLKPKVITIYLGSL